MVRGIKLGPLEGQMDRRFGGQLGPPGGMNTDVSPTRMSPLQFQLLVNVRWMGDGVRERGGATKINSTVLHDAEAQIGLYEFDVGSPYRCWFIEDGCPSEGSLGFSTGFYDPEGDPQLQTAAYYSDSTGAVHLGMFGGIPYTGVDAELRRMDMIQVPYGTQQFSAAGPTDTLIHTFSGYTISFLIQHEGYLFIGLQNGGASRIARYDGASIVDDDHTGIAEPVAPYVFRNQLHVALSDGKVLVRDDEGEWSTAFTLPGGRAVYRGRNSMVAYFDELYMCCSDNKIYKWDGDSLTEVHDLGAGRHCYCICTGFGYLFYAHNDAAANQAKLGRFDYPSTWDDDHKDLYAQYSGFRRVRGLIFYKGCLTIVALYAGQMRLAQSPGSLTAGTWTITIRADGAGDVNYLLPM